METVCRSAVVPDSLKKDSGKVKVSKLPKTRTKDEPDMTVQNDQGSKLAFVCFGKS